MNLPEKIIFPILDFLKNLILSESVFENEKIILAKPQTFMNNSGIAVKRLIKKQPCGESCRRCPEKLEIKNLFVIHDDIDISLGELKISVGRSSAGHKGVESIIKELGTKNFWRLRIGIKPKTGKPEKTEVFVLENFKKEEKEILNKAINQTTEVIEEKIKEK